MTKKSVDWKTIKAVILDVDGTLYDKSKLHIMLLMEMLLYFCVRPWRVRDLLALRTFRVEREKHANAVEENIKEQQYHWPAEKSGFAPEKMKLLVKDWIFFRPIKYLYECRYNGVLDFFLVLNEKNIKFAFFSDYPVKDKLAALEILPSLAYSSTDPQIDSFKPNPRGLILIAKKLGVKPENCLVIGDRLDRDGEAARRAQMQFFLTDKKGKCYFRLTKELKQCQ